KIMLEMLSALSEIPWGEVQSMDDMSSFLISKSEEGKLKKLNEIIREVLIREREKGKIKDSQELAEAFIADFDLVGLRGVDRSKLNQAFRTGITKLGKFEEFERGKVVKDVKTASQ